MKPYRTTTRQRGRLRGFSLVEAVFSIGVMSFGFLSLAPLLALGLGNAHAARENRATAQIATTLIEQARQGTLVAGNTYLDSAGNPCSGPTGAAFVAQSTLTGIGAGANASSSPASLTRLILRVAPIDRPGSARTYADQFPTPP
jgi:type II secretory pathway pseudopilin PulG